MSIVIFLIPVLILSPQLLNAQSQCFETSYTSYQLPDSILVIPSTIQVKNQSGKELTHEIFDNILKINESKKGDVFSICFNYVQKSTELVKSAVPEKLYDSTARFKNTIQIQDEKNQSTQELLGLEGIQISGAYMRSVSGGGQQSAMMHSVMDLTIAGNISEDLELKARMTDQQMPFEPEGNTQRLQDFDRVNVQLIHENWGLEAGDLLIQSNQNLNFLKFNRQVQGLGVSSSKLSFDSTDSKTKAVTSFARSKTGVQTIEPLEGVLGPYRIEGPQNEPFIFLLAGSEKVYLDGELLERGLENDYVIDYNAAELTFNSKIYISKYSRIQIEFEYSDRQYNRNVTTLQHQQSIGNLDVNIGYFQQSDKPGNQMNDLSESDFEDLSNLDAGASYGEISSADSLGYESDKKRYAKMDTVINAKTYRIFKRSENPEIAHYQVNFTMVGENNGDYRIANSSENGVSYEWVAPVDGIPQGNYAPIKRVALPQNQRIINMGLNYNLKDESDINFEYAGSEFVSNRFNQDNTKQTGNAFSIGYRSAPKELSFAKDLSIDYFIKYEYLDSAFSPVQPFRDVEFNRNWGMEQSAAFQAGEEQLLRMGTSVQNEKQDFSYEVGLRDKESLGNGTQHNVNFQNTGDLNLTLNAFLMNSEHGKTQTEWKKASADLSYGKFKIQPGYKFRTEQHQIRIEDEITSSFQFFDSHSFYVSKQDSNKWNFKISHEFRADQRPIEGKLQEFEQAQNTQFETSFKYGKDNKLAFNLLRREIKTEIDSAETEKYFQGGLNWQSSFWDGNITQNLNFQTGTGRVLQRSYFFMEVARGLGTHSWSDLNENGEQELNEFFEDETEYGDRNYVKVLTMGDNYQTAFINNLQYQLRWNLPKSWAKFENLMQYLGKFSGSFHANLDNKNTFDDWYSRISPFSVAEGDEVLSSRNMWKSKFYYNRGGIAFLEAGWSNSNRKQLMIDGFEGMDRSTFQLVGTLNSFQDWNISAAYRQTSNASFSEVVEERDYQFNSTTVNPKISWQGGNNLRVSLAYRNENKFSPDESAGGAVLVNSIELANKLIQAKNGVMEGKFSYVSVDSDLLDNQSPLAFEMFEGLRAGDNYVWNLSLRRKIIGDLNLILQYIGRKSQNRKTIHNGSVQLTALF
ncbi:MAG: hypothetical protein ACQETL_09455 [Bacteroidota bacterium]